MIQLDQAGRGRHDELQASPAQLNDARCKDVVPSLSRATLSYIQVIPSLMCEITGVLRALPHGYRRGLEDAQVLDKRWVKGTEAAALRRRRPLSVLFSSATAWDGTASETHDSSLEAPEAKGVPADL